MSSQPSWPHPISPSSRLRLVSTSTAQTSWRGCCTLLVGSATSPALFVSLPRAKFVVCSWGVIRGLDFSPPSSSVFGITCRALTSGASATQTLRTPLLLKTHASRPPFLAATSCEGKGELMTCSSVYRPRAGEAIRRSRRQARADGETRFLSMVDTKQMIGEVWPGTQCAWNAFMAAKVYDIGVRLATALLIMAKFTLQPSMPPQRAASCAFPTRGRSRSSSTASPCKLGLFSAKEPLDMAGGYNLAAPFAFAGREA